MDLGSGEETTPELYEDDPEETSLNINSSCAEHFDSQGSELASFSKKALHSGWWIK